MTTASHPPHSGPVDKKQTMGMVVQRRAVKGSLDPFYVQFVRGMEDVLLSAGVDLLMQIRRTTDEEIACYEKWSRSKEVSGVLLVDLQTADERPRIVRELGLPAVILGNPARGEGFPSVRTDDYAAMSSAVAYLASLGHRQIAHIAGPEQLVHTQQRHAAFVATSRSNGIYGQTVHADYTETCGGIETARMLAQPPGNQPTAIIYDNDLMALGGHGQLLQAGYAIPKDMSILAWDDSLRCQLEGITALSRDLASYGALAAETLLNRVNGSTVDERLAEVPHLVVRDSTAPPREL